VDKIIADHNKWTVITSKCRRKGFTPKNLTVLNTTYSLTTANGYEQLTNLQDMLAEDITPKNQDENNILYTSDCDHRINLHHQGREEDQRIGRRNRKGTREYHIRTSLNGKICNTSKEAVLSAGTCRNSAAKNKPIQPNVIIIGDSFLRGIREIVEFSSDNFGIYSMVKPGCKLNTLLESAKSVVGRFTHKDAILICGGSNDLNNNNNESVIKDIMEFIKVNNHTNILASVSVPYDLTYYSQANTEIRSYNKKLMEIMNAHKQVALIEINTHGKYHTRHGLHFNKEVPSVTPSKEQQKVYSVLQN
jgi:hypothetical protein